MERRLDLHVHTSYSPCSSLTLERIEQECALRGIDTVAITDHHLIEGALRLRDRGRVRVIVGEEVSTGAGDIIGLFLSEPIPPRLGIDKTIARIKAQGGLVYVPHPFDRFKRGHIGLEEMVRIAPRVDILEVLNAKISLERYNREAAHFAMAYRIPPAAGSDAHWPGDIGRAINILPDFDGPQEFLAALRCGRIEGHHAGFWSTWLPRLSHYTRILTFRSRPQSPE